MQVLFILAALPLFSLAFVVFDRSADLRRDSAERHHDFEATWGALFPLRDDDPPRVNGG